MFDVSSRMFVRLSLEFCKRFRFRLLPLSEGFVGHGVVLLPREGRDSVFVFPSQPTLANLDRWG